MTNSTVRCRADKIQRGKKRKLKLKKKKKMLRDHRTK